MFWFLSRVWKFRHRAMIFVRNQQIFGLFVSRFLNWEWGESSQRVDREDRGDSSDGLLCPVWRRIIHLEWEVIIKLNVDIYFNFSQNILQLIKLMLGGVQTCDVVRLLSNSYQKSPPTYTYFIDIQVYQVNICSSISTFNRDTLTS